MSKDIKELKEKVGKNTNRIMRMEYVIYYIGILTTVNIGGFGNEIVAAIFALFA